jgi:DsbC/DsbD-like thiol-disulfide interchange protein
MSPFMNVCSSEAVVEWHCCREFCLLESQRLKLSLKIDVGENTQKKGSANFRNECSHKH